MGRRKGRRKGSRLMTYKTQLFIIILSQPILVSRSGDKTLQSRNLSTWLDRILWSMGFLIWKVLQSQFCWVTYLTNQFGEKNKMCDEGAEPASLGSLCTTEHTVSHWAHGWTWQQLASGCMTSHSFLSPNPFLAVFSLGKGWQVSLPGLRGK
jgi:hypothetical protein